MRRLLVVLLFGLSVVASSEDTGLLLGLSARDGKSSTVWVGRQGVATFARRAGDGYWLWKDGGFWHIVNKDLTRSGGRATVTITDPEGKINVIKGEEGRSDTDFYIKYIARRGIGLLRMMSPGSDRTLGSGSFVGSIGGSYPRSYRHYDWLDLDTPIVVENAFGEEMVAAFRKEAVSIATSPSSNLDSDVSPMNWTLERDKGMWSLTGLLYPSHQSGLSNSEQDFYVAHIEDRTLGAHVHKGPNWSRVRSEYPDALDFTTSPDGNLTVIVTPTDVFVHKSNGSSLQRRLQRVRVPAERIVMTQWIEDREVRKVGSAVSKIKS